LSRRKESTLVNSSISATAIRHVHEGDAVLSPESAPMRCLKDDAKERNMLIDAPQGQKNRSIIITDSDHVRLSAVQVENAYAAFHRREGT